MPVTSAATLVLKIDSLLNAAVWLLVSLAVIFIIWNTVQFIRFASSDDRKKYQAGILWGIVGLAVILSIWGLTYILLNTFGTDRYGAPSEQQIKSLVPSKNSASSGTGAICTTVYGSQVITVPCQ
jgi:hypothetical protein